MIGGPTVPSKGYTAMMDDAPSALGPLFGPDFIMVTVEDESNTKYSLEIYPDANNSLLKANGLPQQFYFVPQRIYLAKKQDSPADFDFGMTVFKGLMTTEDTVGITAAQTSGGDVEAGGGFCSFSTTFAIPDSVIANAINQLKSKSYSGPQGGAVAARLLPLLDRADTDPAPLLGIVPILSNAVSIDVPQLSMSGTTAAPMQISAQCAQKGSIEAHGISSFLVTCNQLAAGAIAGSLKAGMSPFTVYYDLVEQFYLPACDITVTIDMDKTFDSFSAAVSVSGWFSSASFQAAWSNCVTNGAIVTDMKINEAAIPDDLKQFIMQNCQQMQQSAMDLVKSEIFNWQPSSTPATTGGGGGGLMSSIFGGASVSMKSDYEHKAVHTTQELKLDSTITKEDEKSGDLSDLEPAVKANINKYLAIVDIGQYFQKVQVAATNVVNWNEHLPDGTNLSDPISQVMIEVGYPDYDQPLGAGNKPNFQTLGQGYHYMVGQSTGQSSLAMWNATNPADVINISFLRLDKPIPNWPSDQVHLRQTLVFDPGDPRVDLSSNQTTVVIETDTSDHTPVLTGQQVGYVFARFACRPIPAAITVTLTITLGPRTDTMTLTAQNQNNAIWEIFSDKYTALTSFTYSVQVQVQGPDWTDTPITYSSPQPISVDLPTDRVKYVPLIMLQLPAPPDAATSAKISDYIRRYQLTPAGTA